MEDGQVDGLKEKVDTGKKYSTAEMPVDLAFMFSLWRAVFLQTFGLLRWRKETVNEKTR